MKRPAFQFYPAEWISDLALKGCGLISRGLWIEMLCLMHQGEPYGHLLVNGNPISPDALANMVGAPAAVVRKSLAELEGAGVFSRTPEGAIYSRRMVRDETLRQARADGGQSGAEHGGKGAKHGSKGGRPRKETGDKKPPLEPPSVSETEPPLNPPPSSSSSSSSLRSEELTNLRLVVADAEKPAPDDPESKREKRLPDCPAQAVVDLYHEVLPELPRVQRLTDARRGHIRARWREWAVDKGWTSTQQGLEQWRDFFAWTRKSKFLMGQGKPRPGLPPFVADFDFLMEPGSHLKLFEGKYHEG